MCGIIGFIDQTKQTTKQQLEQMQESISYRGSDSAGFEFYETETYNLGLGHQRLSILDLTPLGSQPMVYKHLTIIYNGEVYNFAEIKIELIEKGYTFTSHTDTEVILQAFHAWGVACVDKFRGMFAFAIYNQEQEKLYIFRDRAGVKPLYYHKSDNLFFLEVNLKLFINIHNFKKLLIKRHCHITLDLDTFLLH